MSRFFTIIILTLSSVTAFAAEGVAIPQIFSRGGFVFVVEPQRIALLSMDTRSSHALYTAADSLFRISGAVRSGDMIWASNRFGAVIAVNMQTGTIEEFSRNLTAGGGGIDVDRRFVWLASGDTLYRMDLTTREWVSLPIPNSGGEIRGVISFNDQIHVISESAVHVLTTISEDWTVIPHNGFTLTPGGFCKAAAAAYITQERALYRYDPARRSWGKGTVSGRIGSVSLASDLAVAATADRIYLFNTHSLILERQSTLPMLRGIRATAIHNGRAVGVTDRGLAHKTEPFEFDIAAWPDGTRIGDDLFAFSHDGHIISYTNDSFILYHYDRRLWSRIRIMNREKIADGGRRTAQQGWTENGTYIPLTDNIITSVHGDLTIKQLQTFTQLDTGSRVTDLGSLFANTTLNLHTVDADGRFLDITADNYPATLPPQKGFYYRGIDGDPLNRASYGVQGAGLAASRVTPDVITEGGTAVFSGRSKADGGNHPVLTAAAGGGRILSKTEWRGFEYRASGAYRLYDIYPGQKEIDASSVRMYIDGIPLPGTDFTYDPATRTVRLLRREKSNPTSVIQVSFAERVFPDDPSKLEPFPENHYGQYGFVEGAVSPRSWLSARAGIMALDNGTPDTQSLGPMLLAGIPVELRGGANRSLLLYPEIAYDSRMRTHAAGITAGAASGKTFGSYKGLWETRDFNGVDIRRQSYAYQHIRDEHEMNVGYDLRDNLRASLYQLHRHTEAGSLSHFELRSLYTGDALPDIETTLSSNLQNDDSAGRTSKETFALRLSDPSSRLLSELNRIHNVGYDLSWTEYRERSGRHGRALYGLTSVSPTSALTFTASGLYRLNPTDYRVREEASAPPAGPVSEIDTSGLHAREEINPSLSVYARGLPRGFDLGANYSVYICKLTDGGSNVVMERSASGFFYPGEYVNALDKFALYLGYAKETESYAHPVASPLKYVFLTDENTSGIRTTEEAGLLFFPTENLLFSTHNSKRVESDSLEPLYISRNRAKMWLENGGGLEGNLHIVKNDILRITTTYASALYEHSWGNGLMTGVGGYGLGRNGINYGGPLFIISQTKDLSGYIKNIEHSHRLQLSTDLKAPSKERSNASYIMYLRMKIPPNISLSAELLMTATKFSIINGAGGLYMHAGF